MRASVDVVVVGAGHNGLISAAYLARAGLDVVVVEQNERPGGALRWAEWEGHQLELGALEHTAILGSGVIDDLELARFGLTYRTRDVSAVHRFGDGTEVVIGATAEGTAESIAAISRHDADAWLRLGELAAPLLQALGIASSGWLPPWRLAKAVGRVTGGRKATELLRLIDQPVAELADEWFESPHLRALAVFRTQFLGLPPWSPGTSAALLYAVAGHGRLIGRPIGGSQALVAALTAAVEAAGGRIHGGARVTEVLRQSEGWVVHTAGGDEIVARSAVVSAIAPQDFLLRLVRPRDVVPARLRRRLDDAVVTVGNVSQLTLAAALNAAALRAVGVATASTTAGGPAGLDVPQWLLRRPEDVTASYDAIRQGRLHEAPGTLLAFPSVIDPGLAPEGGATMWANVFTARQLEGRSWPEARAEMSDAVWRTIESCRPGLRSHVRHEILTDPMALTAWSGAENPGGHLAPIPAQSLGHRPVAGLGHYRTPIPGLFLTGAGTHPGGGLNGASGRAAAAAVLSSISRGARHPRWAAVTTITGQGRAAVRLGRTLRRTR